jgi:TPR repeat protein
MHGDQYFVHTAALAAPPPAAWYNLPGCARDSFRAHAQYSLAWMYYNGNVGCDKECAELVQRSM